MPETFVVGRDGTIVYKMVGPVTPANLDSVLKVEIEKALKAVVSHRPHPEEPRSGVSKDGPRASWFETREDALLTMRDK